MVKGGEHVDRKTTDRAVRLLDDLRRIIIANPVLGDLESTVDQLKVSIKLMYVTQV